MMAESAQEMGAIVCCDGQWQEDVCRTRFHWSHRLSKMPHPMLLPMLPILWRLVVRCARRYDPKLPTDSHTQMGTRLLLYIGICYIRYYIAYRLLNIWEDAYVTAEDDCWYRDYRPTCFGRAFDFSDHIVLYYGQISPIVTAEVAHQGAGYLLILYSIGLHYLVFHGTFVTAAYFHTNAEVYAGFLVSLLLSVPLYYWQGKQWFPFRK